MSRQFHGLKAWVLQRVTAVYLALYSLYLLTALSLSPPEHFIAWQQWVANPWMSLSLVLFALALALHAWVGVRDIVMDYVKPLSLKLGLLSILGMALIASLFWVVQTIILLHLSTIT